MIKPQFHYGDIIRYRGRTGIIRSIINRNDIDDWGRQGYRYEVLIKNDLWSILECSLQPIKKVVLYE